MIPMGPETGKLMLKELPIQIRQGIEMPSFHESYMLLKYCTSIWKTNHRLRTVPSEQLTVFITVFGGTFREGMETLVRQKLTDAGEGSLSYLRSKVVSGWGPGETRSGSSTLHETFQMLFRSDVIYSRLVYLSSILRHHITPARKPLRWIC